MTLTKSLHVTPFVGQAPPRILHAPNAKNNAWEDIAALSATLGVVLDQWQEDVLRAGSGERRDGTWAARTVGVSAPRQQGKSQLIVARALAGIFLFGEQLIMCSAHQQDTAREVFNRIVDVLEANPSLDAQVQTYGKALNREYIKFKSGQVIRFKARSAGGGRGFSADCLLLDEAQILSAAAWSAMLPTMSARPNPQVWLFGTPPTTNDDGEVFGRIRETGIIGKDTRLAYLEWSAEAGDDFDDPEVWAKANPAFGSRISQDAIEAERSTMTDTQFAMERLGMWEDAAGASVIDEQAWKACADEHSQPKSEIVLAIDVSPDRSTASIGVAGRRADDLWHIELIENRAGTGWLLNRVGEICKRQGIRTVVLDGLSAAASLTEHLKRMHIKVETTSARDMASACGELYDAAYEGRLVHLDDLRLNHAVSIVRKRKLGDAWAWNRQTASSDITPVVAVTLALWGAQSSRVKRKKSSGESERRAVVL